MNSNMSLEEAKALMKPEALQNLKQIISTEEKIDMSKKVNGDAIMVALCNAVNNDIIHVGSLSDQIVKMLNSSTNTVSQSKLGEILDQVRKLQPRMVCRIRLYTADLSEIVNQWVFTSAKDCKFNAMFEFVVNTFEINPQMIRERMSKLLKPTIANNIGQFVSKYELSTHKDEMVVSITTIARLANIVDHIIKVEFHEE